jgi:chromosome segregation ATPase
MKDYIERQKDLLSKKYGKDELVAALLKDIKELKFEKGQMQSEIDELIDAKNQAEKRAAIHLKEINDLTIEKKALNEKIRVLELMSKQEYREYQRDKIVLIYKGKLKKLKQQLELLKEKNALNRF